MLTVLIHMYPSKVIVFQMQPKLYSHYDFHYHPQKPYPWVDTNINTWEKFKASHCGTAEEKIKQQSFSSKNVTALATVGTGHRAMSCWSEEKALIFHRAYTKPKVTSEIDKGHRQKQVNQLFTSIYREPKGKQHIRMKPSINFNKHCDHITPLILNIWTRRVISSSDLQICIQLATQLSGVYKMQKQYFHVLLWKSQAE